MMTEKMYRLNQLGIELFAPDGNPGIVTIHQLQRFAHSATITTDGDELVIVSSIDMDEDMETGEMMPRRRVIGDMVHRGAEIGHDRNGPITLDYVVGDTVRIKTEIIYSGAPYVGEEFYTEKTGTVIAVYLHETEEDNYNPMYGVKLADGTIRDRRNNQIIGLA